MILLNIFTIIISIITVCINLYTIHLIRKDK